VGDLSVSPLLVIVAATASIYAAFLVWYGGRGRPLSQEEVENFARELGAHARHPGSHVLLEEVRTLAAKDDGREFVMQNLVRYRPKALYPDGYGFGDSPREADRRYGRAIIPHLLRYGNVPVFIARRCGRFAEPEGADDWNYVAMIRYRSRRDFLRFALSVERSDVTVHKWAAIEKTHIFPVQPILSLIFVRGAVAVLLTLLATVLAVAVC
jgi:hypothetical protein